ncbi:MAG: hypothetical protein ACOCWM_05680 [Cyclobacteriaceae bacterium]
MKDTFIILYRYHNNFELVRERLKIIKHIDPEVKIYGIFGGPYEKYDEAMTFLTFYLEDNYLVKVEDSNWKWLHADIVYQMWYNDVGKSIDFDYAAVLEWDLLFLEKVQNLFYRIKPDQLHLTGIIPLNKVKNYWFWSRPQHTEKYEAFKEKVSQYYKIPLRDYAMLGPGLCMPKAFMEQFSSIKLFEADISDELKMPVWAQVLGYQMVSNNFYRKWFSFFEHQYFNANVVDVSLETVKKELSRKNGRRAFHPFRKHVKTNELAEIYDNAVNNKGNQTNNKNYSVGVVPWYLYKVHCKLGDVFFENKKINHEF